MKMLNFDIDKLYRAIDFYEDGMREGYIENGNSEVAYLLGAMKIKMEEYCEDYDYIIVKGAKQPLHNRERFEKVIQTMNDFKARKGVTQGDVAFIAGWLGFMLGAISAENIRAQIYDDDVLPPFKPITEKEYEESYDWE